MAYKASERKELLSAINEILDFSIVMPPGDYENQDLLPYTDIKEKTNEIRRRQSRLLHPTKPCKPPLTTLSHCVLVGILKLSSLSFEFKLKNLFKFFNQ